MTFGTIEDGNEDDAFAHSKLIIMWGWNPAYTFHGGNTFYYMRMAKQRGCKFVVVDPQYTDSAAAYDAWWIPIKPNTDAAMLAGMAHYIFANNLQDQVHRQVRQGMDAGTMPDWAKDQESFKDYILGTYDKTPKTPEWAEKICGVKAADIRKLADMYARTKPAALKASWAPGRNAYGEQYNRMAAALQAMTGNIGKLGGCAEGVGKAWHAEAWPTPTTKTPTSGSPRSSPTAGRTACSTTPTSSARKSACGRATTSSTARSPTSRPSSGRARTGSTSSPTSTRKSRPSRSWNWWSAWTRPSRPRACGPTCCCRSPPTSSATTSPCPGTRATTTSTGPR
jgi:anaerobic selenocysteine-containing dehydrogenase